MLTKSWISFMLFGDLEDVYDLQLEKQKTECQKMLLGARFLEMWKWCTCWTDNSKHAHAQCTKKYAWKVSTFATRSDKCKVSMYIIYCWRQYIPKCKFQYGWDTNFRPIHHWKNLTFQINVAKCQLKILCQALSSKSVHCANNIWCSVT